jgi:hypothetical protein
MLGPISGVANFGYNSDSVKWVEGFIERERARSDLSKEQTEQRVSNLGSFLGECVIACFGGEWRQHGPTWGVAFHENNMVFPFGKVEKQFADGVEESVDGWFRMIPLIFSERIKRPQPPESHGGSGGGDCWLHQECGDRFTAASTAGRATGWD